MRDYHVVGYGENVDVPTIDLVSSEKNVIGNLVGSYNDLQDARGGRSGDPAHPEVRLDDFQQAVGDLDSGNVRGRAILVP